MGGEGLEGFGEGGVLKGGWGGGGCGCGCVREFF